MNVRILPSFFSFAGLVMRVASSSSAVAAVAAVATAGILLSSGCSKLVGVELNLQEPCGQENRALNGLQSFRVVASGSEQNGVVAFRATEPAGVAIGLGEGVIVSVEGYNDDITAGPNPEQPSVAPRAVGRSMPLTLGEGSLDIKSNVLVGSIDTFGGPRDAAGDCTEMDTGEPIAGRHAHTASFVPGVNKVLLFGGAVWNEGEERIIKSAEVFDPATGTFELLPTPLQARAYHTATVLDDGRVVIVGGFSVVNGQTAPVINGLIVDIRQDNPYVGDILMRTPRAHHTATLLADVGLLAVIGGCTGSAAQGCTPTSAAAGSTSLEPSIEILNTASLGEGSVPAAGRLSIARAMHAAVAFPSGNTGLIVVAGGLNDTGALRSIEFLQVQNGTLQNVFSDPAALTDPVVRHQMLAFNNAQFVITGGQSTAQNGMLSDATPGSQVTTICEKTLGRATCATGAPMLGARFGHTAARLIDGTIIVVGGVVAQGGPAAEALRFGAGGAAPAWSPTQGALAEARTRAVLTPLGGELGRGFVNQLMFSGGHTTVLPYESSTSVDIYFGK